MPFLKGKRVLIVGIASKLSIAHGIAEAMHREGAELALTYQNEKLRPRVEAFAESWAPGAGRCFPCDVSDDSQIEAVFSELGQHWDGLDAIVHAVGFAPGDQLAGDFTSATTREGFGIAHDISSYSFIALAKAGRAMMQNRNGSLLTLSYLGAEKNHAQLQCHGLGQSQSGSRCPLSGRQPWRRGHPCQRHFSRPDPHPWRPAASVTSAR